MSSASTAILTLVLVFAALSAQCHGDSAPLVVGFYRGKCRSIDVEAVESDVIKEWYKKDPTITAALLRMQFHDCFVNRTIISGSPNLGRWLPIGLLTNGWPLERASIEQIATQPIAIKQMAT
ncbi:hypothetical protein RD792_017189 [Penstemon davidsonii]|uniref:Plant heme peroxidase family profile domain-containing protein n=1 Tax=Penstemon davidsonii TaxID=160366 RepID=A0ABR0CLH8_9LAMI|nr:hypothetical protein RD792_017189 [Penstemon davidsonii]